MNVRNMSEKRAMTIYHDSVPYFFGTFPYFFTTKQTNLKRETPQDSK